MTNTENLKTLDPELIDILNQLSISKTLCKNASSKIVDAVTNEKISKLIAKKNIFIKEIAKVFDLDLEKFLIENQFNIDLQCQKVVHEFEDLFLDGNDEKLTAFIISTEKKLQKLYQVVTIRSKYDDFAMMILENQLSESRRDMLELNELQNEYL